MTSTPVSYSVVRIQDLEMYTDPLDGDAEIIFNDRRESPVETKKTSLENLGKSVKMYVLPIADDESEPDPKIGGVIVGNKLTINPTTGVLASTVNKLTDLDDVVLLDEPGAVRAGDFFVYSNDNHWENKAIPSIYYEYEGGDAIEVKARDDDNNVFDINFKSGPGLILNEQNNQINVDVGDGIRIVNNQVSVDVGNGLSIRSGNKKLDVDVEIPITVAGGKVKLNYGNGLIVQNDLLVLDTSKVVVLDSNGDLQLPNNLTVLGSTDIYQNLTVQKDLQVNGAVKNDLTIDGACDIKQDADVGGELTVKNNLDVSGTTILRQNTSIIGTLNVGSTLQVTGEINALDNIRVISGQVEAKFLKATDKIDTKNLVATGEITAKDYNTTSDARLKENVETIDGALDKVNNLRGVTFDWKRDGNPGTGVIAQELEEVLPRLVVGEEQKSVNYNGLIGVLIQAVKELSKEVEELKNK